jgi:pyruvate formate lyase activating enzyme
MNIQPTYSSLDYPGKMSLVLFTPGCDLRCKYCHNPQLLKQTELSKLDLMEIQDELDENVDFIDGIVLSGGEPLLHLDEMKLFIKKAKEENLLIKLDTNGLHPDKLEEIIDDLDYIAMDIKAPLDKYYKISDVYPKNTRDCIEKTMKLAKDHGVFLECRTTFVPNLLEKEDIHILLNEITCDMYTLQQFRNRVTLNPELASFEEPNPEELLDILMTSNTKIPELHLKTNQFGNQTIRKGE